MKKDNYKDLVKLIKKCLENKVWDEANLYIEFGTGNSCGADLKYLYKNEEHEKVLRVTEYGSLLLEVFHEYIFEGKERSFNKVILTITKDSFDVNYEMDEEKIIKEKQSSALIFPNSLYEGMRTQIYEYEIANNILVPIYDEDEGIEILDYESSWDGGLFTFIINTKTKEVEYTIALFKDGVKRIVPLAISKEYKAGILHHHEVTHGVLKEYWKPWNKIVLTAPEQFIPLGKNQKYIEYSLVDIP